MARRWSKSVWNVFLWHKVIYSNFDDKESLFYIFYAKNLLGEQEILNKQQQT
jgi:hypothetical protein